MGMERRSLTIGVYYVKRKGEPLECRFHYGRRSRSRVAHGVSYGATRWPVVAPKVSQLRHKLRLKAEQGGVPVLRIV